MVTLFRDISKTGHDAEELLKEANIEHIVIFTDTYNQPILLDSTEAYPYKGLKEIKYYVKIT